MFEASSHLCNQVNCYLRSCFGSFYENLSLQFVNNNIFLALFQICYVVVYDDFSLDTDDGQDKTEDAAPDDDDDGDLGQWSAGQGGYGCADDEQGAIHTQVWRALQVKDGKFLTVEIEMMF